MMAQYHHQTERKREQIYGWQRPHLGWTCVLCGQWWTKAPRSWCPGVPAYHDWDKAQAAGLRTMTQWKAERRNVKPDAESRGAMMRGAAHPNDWYDLYTEDQTTPMRAAPRKERESNEQKET